MEFHAHRAVLACASPHLFELFTADDENKGSQRENVITYKLNGGFDRTALEKLIHYAYTARYRDNTSRMASLVNWADVIHSSVLLLVNCKT
jgi:influenza virus NS1A-binding protein